MRRGRSKGVMEEKTNVTFCHMQNLDFTYKYIIYNIKAKENRWEQRGQKRVMDIDVHV